MQSMTMKVNIQSMTLKEDIQSMPLTRAGAGGLLQV